MRTKVNYTSGALINNLKFISEEGYKGKKRLVKMECNCGNPFIVFLTHIKSGHTKSCGCYNTKVLTTRSTTHGDSRRLSSKPHYLYHTWLSIKTRCFNINNYAYRWYGGRGIMMHKSWVDNYSLFKNYILTNLGERPKNYSLDRINNDGNYEPDNLRWATHKEQVQNSRTCLNTKV